MTRSDRLSSIRCQIVWTMYNMHSLALDRNRSKFIPFLSFVCLYENIYTSVVII